MSKTHHDALIRAIAEQRRLRFVYNGKPRLVEPQCYGMGGTGKRLVRVHQLSGGNEPEPLFDVDRIEQLEVLEERFDLPGPNYKQNDSAIPEVFRQLEAIRGATPKPLGLLHTLADWLAYIERQHPRSIALGLERVREVATRMQLQRPAAQVITVGGTNGKGSTVAFIDAIARVAGWSVGTYTSPHLLRYNERVRIDGAEVDDATLVAAFEAVEAARGETLLTYFEYGTLAALWCFERAGLDLAVLEVGLGGRLDAVNIVDADVAVITTVDLDHQDWLGEDRELIGAEKAGIARPWRPLVLGEDAPPATVLDHAYRIGASAVRAGCDFFFDRIDGAHWRWREVGYELDLPQPRLAAPAQLRNAATAIAALRALDRPVPEVAFERGIAEAFIPGRLQRVERDGREIVVDVGHNPQAARELAAWLRAEPPDGATLAVFAALADKDAGGIARALGAQVDRWFLAGLADAGPRGSDVDAFAARLADTPAAHGERHGTVEAALRAALAQAHIGDRILVFGSFHTAAAALQALQPEIDAG